MDDIWCGAQLLLWWAYHFAGPIGLIALKCVVGGAALVVSPHRCSRHHRRAVHLGADIPSLHIRNLPFLRVPPSTLHVRVLRFLCRGAVQVSPAPAGALWALPIVMLAWANLHGGFLAGLGALGLVILLRASENLAAFGWRSGRLAEGTQRLWVTLAACTAVTFVNPLGPRLWVYIVTEVTHSTNRRYIEEWAPASLHRDAWSMIALTFIVVILAVVGWTAHRRAKGHAGPLPIYWVASCVPLIAMSYLSVRHVPLAAIWTGPVITLLASQVHDQLPQQAAFRRSWFVLRGLALLPVCLIFFVVFRPATGHPH
jgi:hypothetical protein